MISRRRLFQLGGAAAITAPLARFAGRARAATPRAKRLVIFYFPDGVPGVSQAGEPSLWAPTGGETSFTLPPLLAPLAPYQSRCLFFRNLSMGPTDSGSHPGGAKKLLTATDGGNGILIDQRLAKLVSPTFPPATRQGLPDKTDTHRWYQV